MTPRPLRRSAAALTAAVLTTLLAACSGGSTGSTTSTLPVYTPEASGAATASASASSSASATLAFEPADPKGIGRTGTFIFLESATARQRKIEDAWMAFHAAKAEALNGHTDWVKLAQTATSAGLQNVGQLLAARRKGKIGKYVAKGELYTVGDSRTKVTKISDSSKAATITFCADDQTYEVDSNGKKIVPAPGIVKVTESFVLVDGSWKISKAPSVTPKACSI